MLSVFRLKLSHIFGYNYAEFGVDTFIGLLGIAKQNKLSVFRILVCS